MPDLRLVLARYAGFSASKFSTLVCECSLMPPHMLLALCLYTRIYACCISGCCAASFAVQCSVRVVILLILRNRRACICSKDWRCCARVTPARSPWRARVACIPHVWQRQSFSRLLLSQKSKTRRIISPRLLRGEFGCSMLTVCPACRSACKRTKSATVHALLQSSKAMRPCKPQCQRIRDQMQLML